ncbi:hypothetical protein ACQ4M3_25475 [Leptolyngbya sp. AN03gr2]|uniref:hypothetical protein n=1 Tax=unclassified Leptolyngbya TaxID=2650499 RepID=UPI003D31CD58
MTDSTIHVGDLNSLRGCQVRVLGLSQFLMTDLDKESPIFRMNSALQFAEAAALLVREELRHAGTVTVNPEWVHTLVATTIEEQKQQIRELVKRYSNASDNSERCCVALQLNAIATTIARDCADRVTVQQVSKIDSGS